MEIQDQTGLIRRIHQAEQKLDNLTKPEVIGPWVDWTPTITQGVAVAKTVNYARYVIIADTVVMAVRMSITGAGTAGSQIVISGIPTAVQPTASYAVGGVSTIGTVIILDSGTAYYHGAIDAIGANDFRFMAHNQGAYIGASPNFGLANGDIISFQAIYERT